MTTSGFCFCCRGKVWQGPVWWAAVRGTLVPAALLKGVEIGGQNSLVTWLSRDRELPRAELLLIASAWVPAPYYAAGFWRKEETSLGLCRSVDVWALLGERWEWERAKSATDPGSGRLGLYPFLTPFINTSSTLPNPRAHFIRELSDFRWGGEGSEWRLLRQRGKKRSTIRALLSRVLLSPPSTPRPRSPVCLRVCKSVGP